MLQTPAVCPSPRRRQAPTAFTLVELLVVIGIAVTLAAIGVGLFRGVHNQVATARARAELASLSLVVERYRAVYGDYPQTADTPEKFYEALTGRLGPTGAALHGRNLLPGAAVTLADPTHPDAATNAFVDPWGHAYQYVFFTRQVATLPLTRGYVLFSFGLRDSTATLPTRADVVPNVSGEQGGLISSAASNTPNLYAGR